MKKKRSIEEEQPKTVCFLGVLLAIAGVALLAFHPEVEGVHKMVSSNELTFINFVGAILTFIGFYFALVILPTPKTK